MTQPLVTVGIPTFNRAGTYLRQAIDAALGQSYGNVEVLLADNCSTDETPEIAKAVKDSRFTYVRHEENIGPRNNMNFLLAKATGEYFLLFADDDQIDPDFVETCMDSIGARRPGLVITGARVIDERGAFLRQKEGDPAASSVDDLILLWYQRKIHLFLASTLFRTQALRDAGGFDEKYGHFNDVAAEFQCAARGGCVSVPAVKGGLRVHSSSITKLASVGEWCDSSIALLDLALALASSNRAKVAAIGRRVSAERNYVLADELPSAGAKWKAYFTVLRKFGYRHWPESDAIKSLASATLRTLFAAR